ncbi:MAG: glycosyltransferase [Methylovulum sp.]|uniref:glycosyltransferase n=1 Tax=Methylovulum sp. TaxID=1916980 RepID=UPI002628B364|nr:glycosyltransferase [Methylovulum sp.]MDD2723658.1 glycosyltransferase [Methylovulum sp.]MDD5123849.1 glycosyltransferase [Methylovulum sp.]
MIKKPKLSVVVAFFNMRREAKRTLYSLCCNYQQNIHLDDYEVLVIDSGSTEPLDSDWVESLQSNFRYYFVSCEHPSPCKAMNFGISQSQAELVACAIDGARILSPNILSLMLRAQQLFPTPLIYTLAMHLGEKLQNLAVEEGYDQDVEDNLLNTIDWQRDGYQLFTISALAGSSERGYTGYLTESNFFAVNNKMLAAIGGFDERFISPGGGFVNLDVFAQLLGAPGVDPVLLLGEATFHQFHGGVATNVPMARHPGELFLDEYASIRGKQFAYVEREPYVFGKFSEVTRRLLWV